jgi:hypothetical protein
MKDITKERNGHKEWINEVKKENSRQRNINYKTGEKKHPRVTGQLSLSPLFLSRHRTRCGLSLRHNKEAWRSLVSEWSILTSLIRVSVCGTGMQLALCLNNVSKHRRCLRADNISGFMKQLMVRQRNNSSPPPLVFLPQHVSVIRPSSGGIQ